jgi:hypothetical protein
MAQNDEFLNEEAPDAPGAEEWIKKNKTEFKRRYNDNWSRVLYAKAWLLFGKNAKNRKDDVKNETSHITVTVGGPVGSGKSAVAKVIQQTLAGGGLDVQFDNDAEMADAEMETDLKGVSAKKVVIAAHYPQKETPSAVNEAATSFVPPPAVQTAAKRGLELRKKHGRGGWDSKTAGENGIGSGVVRAQTLVAGKGVSLDTVKRMRSFFQRHDGEQERAARKRDETSAANIAWLLWGGDAGKQWVDSIKVNKSNGEIS